MNLLVIGIIFVIVFLLYLLYTTATSSLEKRLSKIINLFPLQYYTELGFLDGIYLVLVLLGVILILRLVIPKLESEITSRYWGISTICIMIVLLASGLGFICGEFGKPILTFDLRDATDMKVGYLSCTDSNSDSFLINSIVTCNVPSSLEIFSEQVEFNYFNGSKDYITLINHSFVASANVSRINFHFLSNSTKFISELNTGSDVTFFTESELRSRSHLAIAYVIGLLGVIFFSVPSMMVNLRDLFRKEKNTD